MKKMLACFLALVLLLSGSALAAEKLEGFYTPPPMNEGQYPISQQGVKLSYWMAINAGAANFITSYAENPSYQLIQKETGVTLDFIHPAAGTAVENFRLLMASPNLPDMLQLQVESWYSGGLRALYEDGAIIDLMPYLEEYAPQYLEVIMADETAQRQIIQDGKVLGFYKITYADPMPYVRFNVNKDWLDEFGMSEPKTIAEYEAFFQAVLDNKPGVIPFYFQYDSGEQCNLLMGAFDVLRGFYLKPDGVTAGHFANEEGYKEFLTLMNSWYNKGYLSKDFMSTTLTEAQTMFDAGQLACIPDSVDLTFSRVATTGKFPVTNLPYMRKEADSIVGCSLPNWPVDNDNAWVTVISTSCKDVEAAVQYLNYGYTLEGSLPFSFGVEGEHWNWGEDGVPKFTDEILNNPKGMTISNVSYALKIHFGSRYCYPDSIGHPGTASNTEALRIRTMWKDDVNEQNYLRFPPISLTTEESSARADALIEVNTYANEMMLKFISGAEPLSNFDNYVKTINKYGLDKALSITQAGLDRYLAD